ncbi:MAG: hypothetical protein JST01_12185 [Cyanobacteria bacterium SZAS TMP-1]|nr:hypothetical protein [Cyanobacteria bacterium SZAS TMP-1]
MYWRVQKVGPEQLIRLYGIHILLGLSLIVNAFLWLSRPSKPAMPTEVKQDVEKFARQVTINLLDTSYITCQENMLNLKDELAPSVAATLAQVGVLPRNEQDLRALVLDMSERKQICAVRIDQVKVFDPDANGCIPVQVKGVCAIHSAAETGERNFVFTYLLGSKKDNGALVVAKWSDDTPAQPGGDGQ